MITPDELASSATHVVAPLPRWAGRRAEDVPVISARAGEVPDPLAHAVTRLAADRDVPVAAVLLAVHAKVVGAVTGADSVVVGYRGRGRSITLGDASWNELVDLVGLIEAGEVGHADAAYDTELEVTDDRPSPFAGCLLRMVFRRGDTKTGTKIRYQLNYRPDAVDPEQADRLAGYHLTAMRLLVSDPAARHRLTSLVSQQELRRQIHDFAGPVAQLPKARFPELFTEQVRRTPDAVAVIHEDTSWTYDELNRRANRVAWRLREAGVRPEQTVGVLAERTPQWVAGIIGVLKAGGVYLPLEPSFPAERIAVMVERSDCALVLTDPSAGAATLSRLDAATVLPLEDESTGRDGEHDGDPDVTVEPDQLAYIYFTSGSTGEPRGVMCEHGGMLNHLLAKIEDLELERHSVVAQIAPQCFDISLWQALAALLVGGRTVIISQDSVLDVAQFLDDLVRHEVQTVQVVPSYLEMILARLSNAAQEFPRLRRVSVTGEALKRPVTERWFARFPNTPLINAYGLTETSDDTNHEIMTSVADGDAITVGHPVRNVRIYLLDEQLRPVPLGAPGEIVFSGISVGRGYINDTERTNRVFLADPYFPGQRMYRSGDFGRWLPDGRLEFLGRQDTQVKIRGFRVELGEVENRLSAMPGLNDCAVIVQSRSGGVAQLAAFYAAERELPADDVRAFMAETLPDYMLPSGFRWLSEMPLTDNGKIDRRWLAQQLGEDAPPPRLTPVEPLSDTERWLRDAWSSVLGISRERIGRRDDFFELGGTSLLAIRLAIALDRVVNLKDVIAQPLLSDLATTVDRRLGAHTDLAAIPNPG